MQKGARRSHSETAEREVTLAERVQRRLLCLSPAVHLRPGGFPLPYWEGWRRLETKRMCRRLLWRAFGESPNRATADRRFACHCNR